MSVQVEIPKVEFVNPNNLVFDGDNPNKMTDRQRKALRESMIRWGFIIPIITNNELFVADGQQRAEEAIAMNLPAVPIVKLPIKDIDRRLLRQVLNKLKGSHEFYADAEEFKRIVDFGEEEALKEMIGLTEHALMKHLQVLEMRGTAAEMDVDEDLGEVQCPSCGMKFVPEL